MAVRADFKMWQKGSKNITKTWQKQVKPILAWLGWGWVEQFRPGAVYFTPYSSISYSTFPLIAADAIISDIWLIDILMWIFLLWLLSLHWDWDCSQLESETTSGLELKKSVTHPRTQTDRQTAAWHVKADWQLLTVDSLT